MAKKRYVNDSIRTDNWFYDLDSSEKLLFVYLLTNEKTSICGVYELNKKIMCSATGFNINQIEVILQRFEEEGKAYCRNGYVFIPNFIKNQSLNDNMKKGIIRELNSHGEEKLLYFANLSGFERLGKALKGFGIPYLTLLNFTLPNSTSQSEIEEEEIPKQEGEKVVKKKSMTISEVKKELEHFMSMRNKVEDFKNKKGIKIKGFMKCKKITDDLISSYRKLRVDKKMSLEDITEGIRQYYLRLKSKDSEREHRFSLYKFFTQGNGVLTYYQENNG